MTFDEAYAAGFAQACEEAVKLAAISPSAMRHLIGGGVGAITGGAAGAMSTDRQGLENIPGLDSGYRSRRFRNALIGAGLGVGMGVGASHGLNVARGLAGAGKPGGRMPSSMRLTGGSPAGALPAPRPEIIPGPARQAPPMGIPRGKETYVNHRPVPAEYSPVPEARPEQGWFSRLTRR